MELSEQTPIISVSNLSVGYGDYLVLEKISFEVRQREVFAILGRSGCGKTTLFKAMLGLIEPIAGEVFIDGEKVCPLAQGGCESLLRKVGVLFQSGALFTSLTLAENVAFPVIQHTHLPPDAVEGLVALKLANVGLTGYERFLPAELSGGMQKRAALARAMALDPKILFFDEPSAGLDPVTSGSLDQMILKINRALGTTVVIVTHELRSILAVAGRAIMLDANERTVIAEGKPAEMKEQSDDSRVRSFFNPV